MSDWCQCGHGTSWHQDKYELVMTRCNFLDCECQQFDDRYPSYDSCQVCGHTYSGWLNDHGRKGSVHDAHCACRQFVWREEKKKEPEERPTGRVVEL